MHNGRNGHSPPVDQDAEDLVDVYLHILIESLDETMGVKASLAEQMQGQSPELRNRVLKAFDRRRELYKEKAHRIHLA